MHYEDLTITELIYTESGWYAKLTSNFGGTFKFHVADSNIEESELLENNIVIGRKLLGVIVGNKLVTLNEFTFINSKSRSK